MASLQIDASGPSDTTVPYAVRLRATDHAGFVKNGPDGSSYDPTHDGIFYEWTVDELSGPGGSVTQASPLAAWTNTELNIPTAWNDRNTMYGPEVGFCFDEVGTFRVSLWCVELGSGRTAEQTWEVTTLSQDDIAQVAVVSDAGNWTGEPAGADRLGTADVANWLKGRAGKCRVLFAGGEDIRRDGTSIYVDKGPSSVHFGSFGTGNAKLHRSTGSNTIFRAAAGVDTYDVITFSGIDAVSDWDPTRECGRATVFFEKINTPSSANPTYADRGTFVTIDKCDLGAMLTGWAGEVGLKHGMFVHDTRIRDWGGANAGYAYFATDKLNTVLGTSIHADPDTCLGSMENPFQTYGAPYRDVMANDARTVLACSSFFSLTGWSGGNWPGTAAAQPAIRLATGAGLGTGNARANLDRVVVEGGFDVMSSSEKNLSDDGTEAMNIVMDKLLAVAACNTGKIGSSLYSGVTIRNGMFVVPDIATFATDDEVTGWDFSLANNYAADAYDSPVKLYNVTTCNLASRTSMKATFPADPLFADVMVDNNAAYDPTGGDSDATFDLTEAIAGFAPLCQGQRFSVEKPSVTLASDVANGQTFAIPYPTRSYVTPDPLTLNVDQLDASDFDLTEELDQLTIGGTLYQVADGDFTVDMSDPTEVVIINTSGVTWNSGARALVNLVCKVASNPTVGGAFASPATLPWPKLAAAPQGDVSSVLVAYDDAYTPGTARTSPHPGAIAS